ncbi:sugar transporter [Candidatus Entotheonella serta]|nr:sugar transporter [Candidatus Entotheonella serta]
MQHIMPKMIRNILFFLSIAIWLDLLGCTLPTDAPIADPTPPTPASTYRIGPEDKLTISVWKNEALSQTVVVRPDGMITLPLLNDINAAGLTPAALREMLIDRLQEYINNVELSVIINEIHSLKYSVLGEVANPARYAYKSRLTVLEAIASAGGLKPYAARKRIVILRHSDGGDVVQRIPFNYDQAAASNGTEGNPVLQPGDIVMVPASAF